VIKLHFTYNIADLAQAIKIAEQTAEYADIIGVGSLLLFKEGIGAIKAFKNAFPNKEIFAETKLVEKTEEAITLMAQAGASYVSILAGTFNASIKKAIATAHRFDIKIAVDLLDAHSVGQAAMDATTLGADMLVLHHAPHMEETNDIDSVWHNVRDNTNLPIFITGKVDSSNFTQVVSLKPQGIMLGSPILRAESPSLAAESFRTLIPK